MLIRCRSYYEAIRLEIGINLPVGKDLDDLPFIFYAKT